MFYYLYLLPLHQGDQLSFPEKFTEKLDFKKNTVKGGYSGQILTFSLNINDINVKI